MWPHINIYIIYMLYVATYIIIYVWPQHVYMYCIIIIDVIFFSQFKKMETVVFIYLNCYMCIHVHTCIIQFVAERLKFFYQRVCNTCTTLCNKLVPQFRCVGCRKNIPFTNYHGDGIIIIILMKDSGMHTCLSFIKL